MASGWQQIHADFYLAQVIWQGGSGLPEDQFVQTYTFRNDNVLDRAGMLDAVDTAISNFYGNPGDANPDAIVDWMPQELTAPQIKIFDLGETPPRVPEERQLSTFTPSDNAQPLPREVAVCCSFHVGGPGPRNRGRTFLGPFTINAVIGDAQTGGARVVAPLRDRIAERAEDMATNASLECTWVLWSRANNAMFNVVGGWVDDAFDTIRKRGNAPSTRTTWGAAIASGVGGDPGGDPATSAV